MKDLTFSLLPDCLIPYIRSTIGTVMEVIENVLVRNQSKEEIVSRFYEKIYDPGLNISEGAVPGYRDLFEQTAQKIKIFLREREKDDPASTPHSLVDVYLYLTAFNDSRCGTGAAGCDRWYYQSLGGYKNNAYFLFGTASQFRH